MNNPDLPFLQNQKVPPGRPSILVVTPYAELGTLICESLKEAADIESVSKTSRAISFLSKKRNCNQVILDMELGELNLLNLGHALRQINSKIEILVISKDEPPYDLDVIQPWKFLKKPLLLRDLLVALALNTLPIKNESLVIDLDSMANKDVLPINWTTNAGLATRYLGRLIEKTYAQEALLIQNQGLWSYAGRLPEDSVQEMSSVIVKSSVDGESTDFFRYVKLDTTNSEHAVYVSFISLGIILALIFDPDISVAIIRKQMYKLANTLLLLDGRNGQINALSTVVNKLAEKDVDNSVYSYENALYVGASIKGEASFSPPKKNKYSENESRSHKSFKLFHPRLIRQLNRDGISHTGILNASKIPGPSEERVQPNQNNLSALKENYIYSPQSEKSQSPHMLEMMSDSLYHLQYSCLLIPRFPTHSLSKNKAALISECVKNINISYGWRLDEVEVRSDSLRVTTNLPPFVSPSKYLNIIRRVTSKRIFEDFPTFKKENPSGDYWAPGFIIIDGRNRITDQLVVTFTKQNRKKYGIQAQNLSVE